MMSHAVLWSNWYIEFETFYGVSIHFHTESHNIQADILSGEKHFARQNGYQPTNE